MTTPGRWIVSFEIQHGGTVWNRSVLSDTVPTIEDVEFYYTRICGFTGVHITMTKESVPEAFHEDLLSTGDQVPKHFPAHDLETDAGTEEKRTKYRTFVAQLCEMERSRESLRMFARVQRPAPAEPSSSASVRDTPTLKRRREWVNELLRSLHTQEEEDEPSEDLVTVDSDHVPFGWVFTPVLEEIRRAKGSRLVLHADIGTKWESRLGTDMFPDMVVSRRISTLNWAFQHPTSTHLLKATIDWYLASQCATIQDGMTDWIPEADGEIHSLLSTFRRIKVNERILMDDMVRNSYRQNNVFKLLSNLESRSLMSNLEHPGIEAVPIDSFRTYIHYMLKGFGISEDKFTHVEMVNKMLMRWVRAGMGFRPNIPPLLESWHELWDITMRGTSSSKRLGWFLQTLECNDPIRVIAMTQSQKMEFSKIWVDLYIEHELVRDPTSKIRTTTLHEATKEWCHRFLPVEMFPRVLNPQALGPSYTRNNLHSCKDANGRHTRGVRFRVPKVEEKEKEKEKDSPKAEANESPNATESPVPSMFTQIDLGSL